MIITTRKGDHRHHIIDAFVVGLTDRSTLQKISRQTARGADDHIHIKLPDITPLRDQLKSRLNNVLVSFKPDHGTNGKMYNDTAYGLVSKDKRDPDLEDYNLVTRKKIDSLSEKEIGVIRNLGWRSLVEQHVDNARALGTKLDKNGLNKVLADFGRQNGIKTIRILAKNQSATTIPSAPFKAYAPESFVCVDIWQMPKGKPGKWRKGQFEWQGAFWSYAQCKGESPVKNNGKIRGENIHPAVKFITRLFKNDMIEIIVDGNLEIKRVAGFSTTNNRIDLRPQYETEEKKCYVSINILSKCFKKKLRFTEDGVRKNSHGNPGC